MLYKDLLHHEEFRVTKDGSVLGLFRLMKLGDGSAMVLGLDPELNEYQKQVLLQHVAERKSIEPDTEVSSI